MSDTSVTLSKRARLPIFIALAVVALSIVYPLYFLASAAFRTNADYLANPFGLPAQPTFDNFVTLWNSYGVGQALLNSLFVVCTSLAIVLVLATLAGYAMAKLPVPGAKYITGTFVSVMLFPGQVLIIPIYLLLSRLQLVGEYAGVIVVYVATSLPFAVFFLSLSFRAIPSELIEAAKLDGAGFWRTIVSIIFPMGGSAIATLAVLQFLGLWNELLFALILLTDDSKTLLTPALARIGGRFVTDQPLVAAGLLITSLFPLLLLTFASRYVMQGLAVGVSR